LRRASERTQADAAAFASRMSPGPSGTAVHHFAAPRHDLQQLSLP
jgi:hypothetical protein